MSLATRLLRLRRRVFAPLHDLAVALWTAREVRRLRTALKRDGVRARATRPPRRMSRNSGRVVMFVAGVVRASCLERSLVRQAWLRARGARHDVVIGVRGGNQFEAHAWVDGDPDAVDYVEIHRIGSDVGQPTA